MIKNRGYALLITQAQAALIFEKQNGRCALSGIDLILNAPIKQVTASLDRIDSTKPYQLDNIQWVHKIVNKMKNSFSEDDFFLWVKLINDYKLKKKAKI